MPKIFFFDLFCLFSLFFTFRCVLSFFYNKKKWSKWRRVIIEWVGKKGKIFGQKGKVTKTWFFCLDFGNHLFLVNNGVFRSFLADDINFDRFFRITNFFEKIGKKFFSTRFLKTFCWFLLVTLFFIGSPCVYSTSPAV